MMLRSRRKWAGGMWGCDMSTSEQEAMDIDDLFVPRHGAKTAPGDLSGQLRVTYPRPRAGRATVDLQEEELQVHFDHVRIAACGRVWRFKPDPTLLHWSVDPVTYKTYYALKIPIMSGELAALPAMHNFTHITLSYGIMHVGNTPEDQWRGFWKCKHTCERLLSGLDMVTFILNPNTRTSWAISPLCELHSLLLDMREALLSSPFAVEVEPPPNPLHMSWSFMHDVYRHIFMVAVSVPH